jgi:hypothetical protein
MCFSQVVAARGKVVLVFGHLINIGNIGIACPCCINLLQ